MEQRRYKLVEVLLVEDSPTDILLTRDAFEYNKILNPLRVVEDGVEALDYLNQRGKYAAARLPSLILLDLGLPRLSGMEVLEHIKPNPRLCDIPVVILTTSAAEEDIVKSYQLRANCYISKPVELPKLAAIVRDITEFWLRIVTLPSASI